jgi:hypothetical protein
MADVVACETCWSGNDLWRDVVETDLDVDPLVKRATPFARFPERGRGLFLSEHRRCWPEIIEICNQLVYGGRLVPCREEGERKPIPSLGYAHIPGTSTLVGKRRRNDLEAEAIAKWLASRRQQISAASRMRAKPSDVRSQ